MGPLCLAELCRHGELAAGVAARDLSGQDLLLPDKPAAGTSSAPRGAAPSSSLPPTTAPRGHAPWEPPPDTHRTHTGHWPMLPPSSSCLAGVQAGIPEHCPWLQPHSSHRCAEHGAEPVCAGRARQRGSTRHSTAWHDAELVVSLGPSPCPAQQVPHLLQPPRPWPAVMGACGGATSTAVSCSTLSQGALAAAQTTAPSQHSSGWALLAGSSWIQPPPGSTAVGGSPTRHSCQGSAQAAPRLAQPVPAAGGSAGQEGAATRPPTCYSSAWPRTLLDILPWPLPRTAPSTLGPRS